MGIDVEQLTESQTRFMAKVDVEPGDCWRWTGASQPNGRGLFRFEGKSRLAQEVSWLLFRGPALPEGKVHCICHASCVNPGHLLVETDIDRFMKFVLEVPGGCWEWQGHRGKPLPHHVGFTNGYGAVRFRGRVQNAHRVSWELFKGSIPDNQHVCHRCDNPPCVNPDHLFLGTARDNVQDCKHKGRLNRQKGETRPAAKLTEGSVKEMRRLRGEGWTQQALADHFRVSQSTVSGVVRRAAWVHVL